MRRTPLHLTIVSYPSRLDATLEAIVQTLARGVDDRHALERAEGPSDLRFHVRRWFLRQRSLTRLDVVGHGDVGKLQLGDELILAHPDTDEMLEALSGTLAPRAEVRLLACSVLRDPERGETALRALQRALGPDRTLLAPTRSLLAHDFGPHGLTARAAKCLTAVKPTRRQHGVR